MLSLLGISYGFQFDAEDNYRQVSCCYQTVNHNNNNNNRAGNDKNYFDS